MIDWIDVNNRQPDFETDALLAWNGERVTQDCYYSLSTRRWMEDPDPTDNNVEHVEIFPAITHWFPFPEPPEDYPKRYRVIGEIEMYSGVSIFHKTYTKDFPCLKKAVKYLANQIYSGKMYDIIIVDMELGREISIAEMDRILDKPIDKMVK